MLGSAEKRRSMHSPPAGVVADDFTLSKQIRHPLWEDGIIFSEDWTIDEEKRFLLSRIA
jgi:hypothetical protein